MGVATHADQAARQVCKRKSRFETSALYSAVVTFRSYSANLTFLPLLKNVCGFLFVLFYTHTHTHTHTKGEEERKKGRETWMRGTLISCLSYTLQLGSWPATQACALPGNRTSDLSVYRLALNPLSYTSEGLKNF